VEVEIGRAVVGVGEFGAFVEPDKGGAGGSEGQLAERGKGRALEQGPNDAADEHKDAEDGGDDADATDEDDIGHEAVEAENAFTDREAFGHRRGTPGRSCWFAKGIVRFGGLHRQLI
jgi:hypothetical protein